ENSGHRRERLYRRTLCALRPGAGLGRAGQWPPGRERRASGATWRRVHPGRPRRPAVGARAVPGCRGRGALRRRGGPLGPLPGLSPGQCAGHRECRRGMPQAAGPAPGTSVVAVDLLRWSLAPGVDRGPGAQALQAPLRGDQVPGRAEGLRGPGVRPRSSGVTPALRHRCRRYEHLPAAVEDAAQGALVDCRQRPEQSRLHQRAQSQRSAAEQPAGRRIGPGPSLQYQQRHPRSVVGCGELCDAPDAGAARDPLSLLWPGLQRGGLERKCLRPLAGAPGADPVAPGHAGDEQGFHPGHQPRAALSGLRPQGQSMGGPRRVLCLVESPAAECWL
ncbi:NAD(P)H steroid dehydrogenase, partial [Pseudomonas sp. FEN]